MTQAQSLLPENILCGEWLPSEMVETKLIELLDESLRGRGLSTAGVVWCSIPGPIPGFNVSVPAARVRVRVLATYMYEKMCQQLPTLTADLVLLVLEYEEADCMHIDS